MFTGLIGEIAAVRSFNNGRLELLARYRPQIGGSVAVNGACLTVTALFDGGFTADISHETLAAIAAENLRGKVHIEPAMQFDGRVEGHFVQGHIDYVGKVSSIVKKDRSIDLFIAVKKEALTLIAPKGSVAIDGVSLTVNETLADRFRLTIVPHTLANTLIAEYAVGRSVNIETDLFARYAARILRRTPMDWASVDRMGAIF
ncbi:MAG: riboflavin synthase [Helicobacteraceae bacterium]|jgi:riboflavin synthase|nr:riboflavin synthase [Helicobacteraceae bacterium]